MKALIFMITAVLFLPFFAQAEEAPEFCGWSTPNGCTVFVWQFDEEWYMSIDCDSGEFKEYSGSGSWGGLCRSGWSDGGSKETSLPDSTR